MSFFGSRRQVEEPVPPTPEPAAPPPSLPVQTQHPIGFDTVIGAGASFEGNFTSSSNVRIDGTFTGSIDINGNVLVGETAKINADLHAKNISIAGAVRGNVHGKKVQLLRTGRVWGDINATALTTEEGAFIDGKISMVSGDGSQQPDFNTLVDDPDFLSQNHDSIDADADVMVMDEIGDVDGGMMFGASETYYDDDIDEDDIDEDDIDEIDDEMDDEIDDVIDGMDADDELMNYVEDDGDGDVLNEVDGQMVSHGMVDEDMVDEDDGRQHDEANTNTTHDGQWDVDSWNQESRF